MLDKFKTLEPDKKRKVVMIVTGMAIGLILILIIALRLSDSTPPPPLPTVTRSQELNREDAALADKFRKDAQIKEQETQLAKQNKELEELQKELEASKTQAETTTMQPYDPSGTVRSFPQPPNADGSFPPLPPRPSDGRQQEQPVRRIYGITSITPELRSEPIAPERPVKTNFIPANTKIRAITLNGVYAPTRASGKSSPYPVILRVHDMAFLPNDLQRDLKGCELQGEAHGELQESRVHIRIIKITCVSRDGRRVLEKDMEGWVNGEDGIVGMAGVVEDNFGMLLSKTFLAQTIAGLGEALQQSTQVITTSPLGGIQQYTKNDYQDMALMAAGKGLGESFNMIARFMMDLLRDQSPVIRVNARREVDVVVRTGLELITEEMRWVGVVDSEHLNEVNAIINELKGLK
jgi:conjugal transfer pilus assembly protein TraB